MQNKVSSERGGFKPIEIMSVTLEVKTSLKKMGDEVAVPCLNHTLHTVRSKKSITTSREQSNL
ncbi:MAG: hypothetical protein M1166_07210 [Candidatus Thermoplasmatota archaeon]|nr:hypothetical protein [Candidatus Thermoplasmatota archaeon]